MRFLRALDRLNRAVNRAGMVVAALFICVLTVLVAVSVLFRYVFNAPILFADEISQYMLVGIVFLALGYTMQQEGHIRVDLVVVLLPEKAQKVVCGMMQVVFFLYALLLTAGAVSLFRTYLERGTRAFTMLETPLIYPSLLLVIGSTLLLLEIMIQILRRFLVREPDGDDLQSKRTS